MVLRFARESSALSNVPIKHSQCSKSLGVLIDENLTWKNLIDVMLLQESFACKNNLHLRAITSIPDKIGVHVTY